MAPGSTVLARPFRDGDTVRPRRMYCGPNDVPAAGDMGTRTLSRSLSPLSGIAVLVPAPFLLRSVAGAGRDDRRGAGRRVPRHRSRSRSPSL